MLDPEPMPLMQTDDLYISKYSFPIIRQANKYYCGPASTVMALIGSGASGYYYTRNTDITDQWQRDLGESDLATTHDDGTEITYITDVMRAKVPSKNGFTYKTKAFTFMSYEKTLGYISSSLVQDAVPIIRIDNTNLLKYYEKFKDVDPDLPRDGFYTHLMVVESVDFNAECVNVYDPHFSDLYFGSHSISFDEFNDMIIDSPWNFWISVYTRDLSDDPFIYT